MIRFTTAQNMIQRAPSYVANTPKLTLGTCRLGVSVTKQHAQLHTSTLHREQLHDQDNIDSVPTIRVFHHPMTSSSTQHNNTVHIKTVIVQYVSVRSIYIDLVAVHQKKNTTIK